MEEGAVDRNALASLPPSVTARIAIVADWTKLERLAGILFEGDGEGLRRIDRRAAEIAGAIVAVHALSCAELAAGTPDYPLEWLVEECSVSTNTAAAGGNASLLNLG